MNKRCLAYFGLKWLADPQGQTTLEKIGAWGLPQFLSPNGEDLLDNSHVISTTLTRGTGVPHRRLVLAYDRTYLMACTQLMKCHLGSAMTGGCHRPDGWESPDESIFKLDRSKGEQQFDIKKRLKATEMASFVLWDSTRCHSPKIETASYPCLAAASKHSVFEEKVPNPTHSRGNLRCLPGWVWCSSRLHALGS